MISNTKKISQYNKSWAVIIGINNYLNYSDLSNAINDAKEFAFILKNNGFDEIIELYDDEATKNNIITLLIDNLSERITDQDRVLIYYAGHAKSLLQKRSHTNTGYLIPFDGNDKKSSLIDFNEFVKNTISSISAKHILFLLDCCFSGLAILRSPHQRAMKIPSKKTIDFLIQCTNKEAIQIISAGGMDEEVLDEGQIKGHSPFTEKLIKGLTTWEADMHNDGIITATELGDYLIKEVSDVANIYGHSQKPIFNRLDGDRGGEFILMISKNLSYNNLEEYRKSIQSLPINQLIDIIKNESNCMVRGLIIGSDITAITYYSQAKNPRDFEVELITIIKVIGKMFIPTIKYRVTIDNNFNNSMGDDLQEIITAEVSVPILKKFIEDQLSLENLWKEIKFFRKESHIGSIKKEFAERFDLVI